MYRILCKVSNNILYMGSLTLPQVGGNGGMMREWGDPNHINEQNLSYISNNLWHMAFLHIWWGVGGFGLVGGGSVEGDGKGGVANSTNE